MEAHEPELKRRKVDKEEDVAGFAWERLPEELFQFILSFIVPRFPRLLNLQLVCKDWHRTISQPSSILWGGLQYYNAAYGNKLTSDVVVKYLSRCPADSLTSFFVRVYSPLLAGEQKPPKDRSQDGSMQPWAEFDSEGLIQLRHFIDLLADRASNLTDLDMQDLPFYAVPKESVIRLAQNCISLKRINLSHKFGTHLRNSAGEAPPLEEYASFVDFLENLPSSSLSDVSLNIDSFPWSGPLFPFFFPKEAGKIRKPQPAITKISISDESLDEYGLPSLFEFLPSLHSFEAHTYWGGMRLTNLPGNLINLGFGERDLHCSDILMELASFPQLRGLKLFSGIPNFTDLAMLSNLESLTINEGEINREDEDMVAVDMMFHSLCNLKYLDISSETLFPSNLSKYVITQCSPLLETMVFHSLIPIKHIAHLLDGTFDDDDDDDEDEEEEEGNEGDEDEEEEEEEEIDEAEKEKEKKRKDFKREWKLKQKAKKGKKQPRRNNGGGLTRIEVVYENDEHCTDPSETFDETEWGEWYQGALELVKERHPSVKLIKVEPKLRAVFVKAE